MASWLKLIASAEKLDSSSRELIFNFYNKATESMYPVGGLFGFPQSQRSWMNWLIQDIEYMHLVLFCILIIRGILTRTTNEIEI